MVNGIDDLAVTNVDGLDTVETIKVCIGYRDGSKRYDYVPNDIEVLARCKPIYAEFPGWRTPTHKARTWKDLPAKTRSYLKALAELSGAQAGHRVGRAGAGADDYGVNERRRRPAQPGGQGHAAAACGHHHGRQRPVGQAAAPAAHRGPSRGGGIGARHHPHRGRAGHQVPDALRLLGRELEPAQGRGGRADEVPGALSQDARRRS